jgi:hypothetical protein
MLLYRQLFFPPRIRRRAAYHYMQLFSQYKFHATAYSYITVMCGTSVELFYFFLQVEQEFTVWFESTLLEGPKTIHVAEVHHSVFSHYLVRKANRLFLPAGC